MAHGTTNGSTAQVAETIGEVLHNDGLTGDVLPARPVASVSSYDTVVIGGAVYTGRRHKDARRFVRRHRRALAERPLRLFSSGRSAPRLPSGTFRPCPERNGP